MDRLLFFVAGFCCVSAFIKIKELKVPNSIEIGSTEEIILDCNFEANNEDSLELKWFYNGEVEQIYQWIPESNKPGYAMGRLKGHLDLAYSVSNDTNTKYRALKIKDISPELSGNYTCKVSSFNNEEVETKQLIIYSPADSGLNIILDTEMDMVMCNSSGIYPEPELDMYILSGENETRIDIEEVTIPDKGSDGFFNITSIHYFDSTNFTGSVKFGCDLKIPGTDYLLTETVDYYIALPKEDNLNSYDELTVVNKEGYNVITFNSTEENFNTTKDNSGITHLSTTYLSTLFVVLLLILSK